MSLQSKFFIIFGVIFLSFGVLQFAINQFLILPSFIKLENNVTIQNLKRVNQSVKKELKHLDSLCHDWGAWDDSYDFIESGSIKYKEGTLTIGSFITGNLNLIYFVKPTGKVHWGKMYDLIDEKEIQLNAFSPENFPDTYASINWSHDSLGSLGDVYKRGVLLTEKGLLMLAARPILTSNNKGPIRGTLIMGRFLNESILNRLKKDTGVNFKLYICNENIPLRLQQVVKKVTYSGEHFVEKKKDNVFAYDSFPSIQGPPAFLTEIIFPREIAKQGMKTVEYSLFFLIAAELVILIVILFVIEVIILNPISDISRHTKQIEAGNYELRLGLNRKDDIGEFADSFDKMVERIELQTEQLERLSSVDGLTGLCNRRIFDEALSREWKRRLDKKQYLSVILCDVDFFKLFNDNYGHRAGDESLQLIADSIRAVPKKASSFAARYGGEEFVILLPNTSPEEAKGIAENIRKKVEGLKIQHKKSEVSQYVTLSLGVASVVPNQQIVPGDLVETADQALYQSKKEGRNTTTSKKILS